MTTGPGVGATYWFSASLAGLARDLGLPPGSTLSDLHRAVCAAFDWPAGDAHRLLHAGRVYAGPALGEARAASACRTPIAAVLGHGDVLVHQPDGGTAGWSLLLEVTRVGGRRVLPGPRQGRRVTVPAQVRGARSLRLT